MRAHLRSNDRWFERRVTFSPADSRTERGRTLGFAFASLLLADGDVARPATHDLPPAASVPVAAPAATAPSTVVKVAAPPEKSAAPARERSLAIELAALAATGVGGPGRGLGASLHAEWAVRRGFFARAGAAVRSGPVPGLDGGDTLAGVGVGLAYRPWVPDRQRAFGLGLTLEALGLYQDLSHRSVTGSMLHEGRLVAGVTGGVESSWRITDALDLFAALGAEVVFSSTDVTVAGREVATLPIVRPTAQAGLRWHD